MAFYDNGLQFECQQCRYCCGVEPGFVFLSQSDIDRAAEALGLKSEEFELCFCRKVQFEHFSMLSLKEKANNDCIFLTREGCRIYKARPVQCATYPFWRHNLEDEEAWNEEARHCPGFSKGRLYSKEEIEEIMKMDELNVPKMILDDVFPFAR